VDRYQSSHINLVINFVDNGSGRIVDVCGVKSVHITPNMSGERGVSRQYVFLVADQLCSLYFVDTSGALPAPCRSLVSADDKPFPTESLD